MSGAVIKFQDEAAGETLPSLIDRAARTLADAKSSAEVLEAHDMAAVAYDVAKRMTRIATAKGAHDTLIAAAHRTQGDALLIEARAKHRMADEYDSAQARGEIRANGERSFLSPEKVGFDDAGLSPRLIHEARQVRDAEVQDPGIVQRTVEDALERGEEPTKTMVRGAVSRRPPMVLSIKGRELDRLTRVWRATSKDVQRLFLQKNSNVLQRDFPDIFKG